MNLLEYVTSWGALLIFAGEEGIRRRYRCSGGAATLSLALERLIQAGAIRPIEIHLN